MNIKPRPPICLIVAILFQITVSQIQPLQREYCYLSNTKKNFNLFSHFQPIITVLLLQHELIKIHNDFRGRIYQFMDATGNNYPRPSNMYKLRWDEDLANGAYNAAISKCKSKMAKINYEINL